MERKGTLRVIARDAECAHLAIAEIRILLSSSILYVDFEQSFKQFQLNILATIFVTILKIIRVNTCTWPLEGLSYIATASLWPSARVTVILVAICMSNSKPLYVTILGIFLMSTSLYHNMGWAATSTKAITATILIVKCLMIEQSTLRLMNCRLPTFPVVTRVCSQ